MLEDIIKCCSVCNKVFINDEWVVLDLPESTKYTHGVCSPECIVEGFDLPYETALSIYKNE